MQDGQFSEKFMRSVQGLPFYCAKTAPTLHSSPISFEAHFNPDLKVDSDYFNSLEKLITCVEMNSGKSLSED